MTLWIIFTGLTIASMVAVLWPFLRPSAEQPFKTGAYGSAVFKDQLDEIASDRERGVISKAEAKAAQAEVSRRLLAVAKASEGRTANAVKKPVGRTAVLALICAFICIPVVSASLYLLYGSPALPDKPLSARLDAPAGKQNIQALVAQVEARLRDHPEDGRGWEVIAPVYMRQQRFGDAADAFAKALRLLGETPGRLVDYGTALIMAHDGVVTEAARQALQKAVLQDASLIRGHFWLALAQEQDGKYGEAAKSWRELLKRGDASAPWQGMVRERLAAAEQRAGISNGENAAAGSGADTGGIKGPSKEDIDAAQGMKAMDRSAMINRMVAGLAKRLNSDGGSVDEWKRLVRSYTVLGNKQAAVQALADARGAYANDDTALASLAKLANELGL